MGFVCVLLLASCIGCSDQAKDSIRDAAENAEGAAEAVAQDAEGMAETAGEEVAAAGKKAGEVAAELGTESIAFLSSIKERFGNLDSLKQKPEELKKWVDEMLQLMDEKAENVKLPQLVSDTMSVVKEKLVALKDYLAGEVEQAKIDEHVQGIIDSAKKGLGLG